jgi:ankyrin repeat protein
MYWGKGGQKPLKPSRSSKVVVVSKEKTVNEQFLQFMRSINNPPLYRGEAILLYLEYLIDQGVTYSINIKINGKVPLLHHVIYWLAKGPFTPEKQRSVIEKFIKKGVDINATDSKGVSALMYAAMYDVPMIAQILLENGADLNAKSKAGKTAVLLAQEHHSDATFKVLRAFSKHKIP